MQNFIFLLENNMRHLAVLLLLGVCYLGAAQDASTVNTAENVTTVNAAEDTTIVTKEKSTYEVTIGAISEVSSKATNDVSKIPTEDESVSSPRPTVSSTTQKLLTASDGPTTTDVCGLSLVSLNEQAMEHNRKCSCSDFNEEVDCSHLGIKSLPKLISLPKSARDVKFSGNKIENIAEDTFYNGRYVINLDLSRNQIDFISIVAFQAFKNLRRLDLSHNKIWNIPTKSFEGLSALKYLNLGYNDITVLNSDLFSSFPNLIELDLQSNPLIELEPKVFEHLKYLEILNLESTLLKVIPDHLFVFTSHLKTLDLSNNQLTYVPTDALKFLHQLHLLQLSGNPIKVIEGEAFVGMRTLVLLYLDRMPLLSKIEKYAFGNLQSLQELHCSYNFLLTEVDEKAFVKKSTNKKIELSQLFLRQNSLSDLPEGLLNWDENMELHLNDNPISCDCHAEWMVHLRLKNEFQKHAT